jgi:hypothetical protein
VTRVAAASARSATAAACVALVALLPSGSGCAPDACRGQETTFEVTVSLGPAVPAHELDSLEVEVRAGSFHRARTFTAGSAFGDGQSSFAVKLGSVGSSFEAEVTLTARAAGGRVLATAQRTFSGSGDACNFFAMSLSCDSGEVSLCGSNVGECRFGTATCVGGRWGSC